MTAPWRSGEISRLEPQKSCSARAKQCQTSSQIRQIYIEYHRVNRAIEIHWVHSTSELSDFRLIGTSVLTNITTWGTCRKWHKSEHPELICEHERHNLHIKTVQIHSAQVTTVLLSKRTTWEQHGLSLENWQQTRVVHVSSVSDLVLCSSLLETPKWHNVTCDTMWQNIWQCHSGLAKGKTMHRPLGQELFWRWLATLSWQESVPHFSGHVKAHSGLTIGFSPENLFTLIWIHMDPHPHLMEFSRLWYVMIALYSLWLYESMIIHINPWYSKESSGIFGIRPAWTGHQICSGLGRSSQWRPRCWLQWPGAGDGFGDGLVR